MKLYLYDTDSGKVLLKIDGVLSYTADQVVTEEGVFAPLAAGCELSSLPDCSETLRADWRKTYPTQETRLEEVEALLAALLFGGDAG